MKITISKNELTYALDTVIKATAMRTSVPSLSGILISTEQDNITFFATDLETSIKTTANGLIDESGSVAVPGKIFTNIIKSLDEASVVLETTGESITIRCNQSFFEIRTLNVADFTRFPEISGIQRISLPTNTLTTMVRKASKAVSRDETRAILTGILLKVEENNVIMVSTDSYRLAMVENKLEKAAQEPFESLIPGKAFDEVVRMAGSSEEIEITLSSNQIMFKFGTTAFVTRRLEGNFPNYSQIIPKEWSTRATIEYSELANAVKRISLLALNNTAIKIECVTEDQKLALSAQTQDVGNAKEDVVAKIEGDSKQISFNHAFIQDGLSVIDNEYVTLEVTESMKPGVIRSAEENFIYLMMPVRSNQ